MTEDKQWSNIIAVITKHMQQIKAAIHLIGINPYVLLPDKALQQIFKKAGKNKGPIPVKGTINEKNYKQTLVKYAGLWRLYINTTMLKDSPRRIGEMVKLSIDFDPEKRIVAPHPKFEKALRGNKEAAIIFDGLRPSLQLEIVRYIANLKTTQSIDKNIIRAIDFLLGKGRFVGRDKP